MKVLLIITVSALCCSILCLIFLLVRGVAPSAKRFVSSALLATICAQCLASSGIVFLQRPDSRLFQFLRWLAACSTAFTILVAQREGILFFLEIVVVTGELKKHADLIKFRRFSAFPLAITIIYMPINYFIVPFGIAKTDWQRELSIRIGAAIQSIVIAFMGITFAMFARKVYIIFCTLRDLNFTKGVKLEQLNAAITTHIRGSFGVFNAIMGAAGWLVVAAAWGHTFVVMLALLWSITLGCPMVAVVAYRYKPKENTQGSRGQATHYKTNKSSHNLHEEHIEVVEKDIASTSGSGDLRLSSLTVVPPRPSGDVRLSHLQPENTAPQTIPDNAPSADGTVVTLTEEE